MLSQTDLCETDLNVSLYRGMYRSMAEALVVKQVPKFYERWCAHMRNTGTAGIRHTSGVELL